MKKSKEKKLYTKKELVEWLRGQVRYGVSAVDLSRKYGISRSYLSEVLAGKKDIGSTILEAIGAEVLYRF